MKEISLPPRSLEILQQLILKRIYYTRSNVRAFLSYHTTMELGEEHAKASLDFVPKVKPLTELTDVQLGAQGERACCFFLDTLFAESGRSVAIEHVNAGKESFKPYDISLDNEVFIDVKTTRLEEDAFLHLSLPEAAHLCKFPRYYFIARVFPLLEGKYYRGIQLSSSWGMNIFKVKDEHIHSLRGMIDEMKNVTQGTGFKIKTAWLQNILVNNELSIMEDLIFDKRIGDPSERNVPGKISADSILENFVKASFHWDMDAITDPAYQYKVYHLLRLFNHILRHRGNKDFQTVLKDGQCNKVLGMWGSGLLRSFVEDSEYLDREMIRSLMIGYLRHKKDVSQDYLYDGYRALKKAQGGLKVL